MRRAVEARIRSRPHLRLERLGSHYGGWIVPLGLLQPGSRVYSGGIGEDATFDLAIIERLGAEVFAFDPTPRAIAHVAAFADREPRFRFLPVGLWDRDATLRFYAPRDASHVSHSVMNLQRTTTWFEAEVRSLESIMRELGHDEIDLLKIDIEGAEHAVLRSLLQSPVRPRVVCFEVDQPVGAVRFWRTMRALRAGGYEPVAVDHWNFTFVRRDLLQAADAADPDGPMPRITFGVIVLNGEPFTAYTLRSLYPFAHQIIVVEGAAPAARNIATADGHSRDGTLERLRRFKAEEDPEDKVTIVTAEDEGHDGGWWPGEKDEQSRAYATRATGDYLWQVDIDEFYRADDMARVIAMLRADPSITAMTFKQLTFWGGLGYLADGWYLRRGATFYHRLFKWGPGYEYASHRPPTVLDAGGTDTRNGNWVRGESLAREGINLFHYSLLLPKQVIEKCDYYGNVTWTTRPGAVAWAQDAFLRLGRPFRVHNVYDYPSWLERYAGRHPDEIVRMMGDLASSAPHELRRTDDIERLLGSWWYPLGRVALRGLDVVDRTARTLPKRAAKAARRAARKSARAARRILRKALRRGRRS